MSGQDAYMAARRESVREAAERSDALIAFVRDRLSDEKGRPPADILLARLAAHWSDHPGYDPEWARRWATLPA